MNTTSRVVDIALGVIIVVTLVVVGYWFVVSAGPIGCTDRWEPKTTEWSPTAGCRVLTESGYVPEVYFRVATTP